MEVDTFDWTIFLALRAQFRRNLCNSGLNVEVIAAQQMCKLACDYMLIKC